jgi:hypothetical protein
MMHGTTNIKRNMMVPKFNAGLGLTEKSIKVLRPLT